MNAVAVNNDSRSPERRQWQPRYSARVRPEPGYRCPVCPTAFGGTLSEWEGHLATPLHRYNYYCSVFQNCRDHKAQNRHGVKIITHCSTEEVVYSESDGTVKSVISTDTSAVVYEFEIMNRGKLPVTLCDVYLLHPYPVFEIHSDDDFTTTRQRLLIHPSCSCILRICFKNTGIGSYGVPIAFNFWKGRNKNFDIVRVMVINVVGPDHLAINRMSESPFTGEDWEDVTEIIRAHTSDGLVHRRITGYRLSSQHYLMFENWLGPWRDMTPDAMEDLFYFTSVVTNGYAALPENYDLFFHTLIHLEEYDAQQSLSRYNMTNAEIKRTTDARRIELNIPGLEEKRPSLVKGDLIFVRIRHKHGPKEYVAYEGVITHVNSTSIWMSKFAPSFYNRLDNPNITFDVKFSVQRYPLYMMHRAIDLAISTGMLTVLFPDENLLYDSFPPLLDISENELMFFNPEIESDTEQVTAVRNILDGSHRPAPYILFGPPGTGKTITIVESILQITSYFPNSRILVCSTSNAACDVIAQKLLKHCGPELIRLYSSSRDWDTIPEFIKEHTNKGETKFYFPRLDMIAGYQIVVCTLITASRLKVPPGDSWYPEFTHIFIDECGQAHEPESLSAISGILGYPYQDNIGGQLILAGDPQQLGPVCMSMRGERILPPQPSGIRNDSDQVDNRIGLGVSLLERLMTTNALYRKSSDGSYDHRFITKLLSNYRSHPKILDLPNRLFYGNELKYRCPETVLNDPILNYPLFGERKGKMSPLMFHGVVGQELTEGESPSYFNPLEVEQVMVYVEKLFDSHLVTQKDIGIISPYIRQVYKIKQRLEEKGWRKVETGSTESFQGQEKRIIIISLVRGNKNLIDLDHKYQLGFLTNPRRFNVAMTRAKSLMIIIGNPFVLGSNQHWLQLMRSCRSNHSYVGCAFQIRDAQWIKTVSQRIDKLIFNDS